MKCEDMLTQPNIEFHPVLLAEQHLWVEAQTPVGFQQLFTEMLAHVYSGAFRYSSQPNFWCLCTCSTSFLSHLTYAQLDFHHVIGETKKKISDLSVMFTEPLVGISTHVKGECWKLSRGNSNPPSNSPWCWCWFSQVALNGAMKIEHALPLFSHVYK